MTDAQRAAEVFADPSLSAGRRLLLESKVGPEIANLLVAILRVCELDDRSQEAFILTMARALSHEYAWQEHVPRALEAGLTVEEVRAIGRDALAELPEALCGLCEYVNQVLADVNLPDPWPASPAQGTGPDPFAAFLGAVFLIFSLHRSSGLGPSGDFVGWELEKL